MTIDYKPKIYCPQCKYWADLPNGRGYETHDSILVKIKGICINDTQRELRVKGHGKSNRKGSPPSEFYHTDLYHGCYDGELKEAIEEMDLKDLPF